eukprot:s3958_g2.t1
MVGDNSLEEIAPTGSLGSGDQLAKSEDITSKILTVEPKTEPNWPRSHAAFQKAAVISFQTWAMRARGADMIGVLVGKEVKKREIAHSIVVAKEIDGINGTTKFDHLCENQKLAAYGIILSGRSDPDRKFAEWALSQLQIKHPEAYLCIYVDPEEPGKFCFEEWHSDKGLDGEWVTVMPTWTYWRSEELGSIVWCHHLFSSNRERLYMQVVKAVVKEKEEAEGKKEDAITPIEVGEVCSGEKEKPKADPRPEKEEVEVKQDSAAIHPEEAAATVPKTTDSQPELGDKLDEPELAMNAAAQADATVPEREAVQSEQGDQDAQAKADATVPESEAVQSGQGDQDAQAKADATVPEREAVQSEQGDQDAQAKANATVPEREAVQSEQGDQDAQAKAAATGLESKDVQSEQGDQDAQAKANATVPESEAVQSEQGDQDTQAKEDARDSDKEAKGKTEDLTVANQDRALGIVSS